MSIYRMRTEFGQHLKWVMLGIAVVFIVGAVWQFGAAPATDRQGGKGGSDVIATVNGIPISRAEFEGLWSRASEEARSQGIRSPLQYADYRAMIFQQMVQSRLILSAAEQMGIDVSEKKVESEIDKQVVDALKQNRDSIMGSDLTKEQRKLDPRDDAKYKKELASIQRSLGQMEEAIRSQISPDDVRAKIAAEGIQKKLEQDAKTVSEQDIKDSYNVYKVRQMAFMKGQMPEDQLKTRIDKIMTEIRGGGDFAKIAKDNAQGPMGSGDVMEYSFDSRWQFVPEVRSAIEKLKPGGVTPPVKTSYGTFIVKLESVTPKLPAKLDKKTRDERRKQIIDDRKMTAAMAFQKKMQDSQQVKVTDPEMLAYWQISQAQQSFGEPDKAKKEMTKAISSLTRARTNRMDNTIITSKLAQLLHQNGKTKQGLDLLYPMLEGDSASMEGADLRMLLGDMLIAESEKEQPEQKAATVAKAVDQYKIAGEVARHDPNIHQQLVTKFQQLGKPDLVAAEQKWLADYQQQMQKMQEEQQKNAPKPKAPAPKK